MQHADRPAEVEALAHPARHRRPRVNLKSLRVVSRAENLNGIRGNGRRSRDGGEGRAVGSPKAERSVGLAIDLVPLLVDGAVVATTKQREIRQRCQAAVSPVVDVVALAESHATAREATASVAVVKRAT